MDKTQKVRECIIEPMVRLYGASLNDAQVEAFVEDLGGYSEPALREAWKDVRRTCKTRPTLAHIIDAVKGMATSGPVSIAGPGSRTDEYRCHRNDSLADRTIRSPVGQQALREGVGNAVWMLAWRDNRENISAADVRTQKAAWLEACNRLARLPHDKLLHRMHDAFMEREATLRAKYLREAA